MACFSISLDRRRNVCVFGVCEGYKFQDYFSAFHLDFLSSFAMLFSVALSVIEFVLGVHLLFGSYRKSTPRLIFIFLCVMKRRNWYVSALVYCMKG